MDEIVKHINDTNASYRNINAGDAKNTDLFLDNEHYEMFKGKGEQVTVRYNKNNLTQAILFIASILPRKFDQSAIHEKIEFSKEFVLDQLAILDALFVDGEYFTQEWTPRKDVPQKNGKIDTRFYFNGLLKEVQYVNSNGNKRKTKFTIRNYFAGGYSELHIRKADDGIFDIDIQNVTIPSEDNKERELEILDIKTAVQQIYFGAPGTGKSHKVNEEVGGEDNPNIIRTTFHPDSDYSTFIGCYKPQEKDDSNEITYKFCPQAFAKAYVKAWQNPDKKISLVIEEINRGNCAQIFGDIFQLLDRDSTTGESSYTIAPDNDLRKYLADEFSETEIEDADIKRGNKMKLPSNLSIYATMNTSDQSLFPIDSAFKRRWDWKYIPINKDEEGHYIECGQANYDWWDFLTKVNDRIDATIGSEDKQLGFWFAKPEGETKKISAERFVSKVVFYLWNDVFKDYSNDGNNVFKTKTKSMLKFRQFFLHNGDVDKETLKSFLDNLGVTENVGETEGEESSDGVNE